MVVNSRRQTSLFIICGTQNQELLPPTRRIARELPLRTGNVKKTVLVIVGMPGAGKSLASSMIKTRGIPVFLSHDIITAKARKRQLIFSQKILGDLMLDTR